MAAGAEPPRTSSVRALPMSRRRSATNLVTSMVIAGVGGLWIIWYDFTLGWFLAGYGAFLGLLHGLNLMHPVTLRLDADGFVVPDLLRRPRRREWSQVSAFTVWGPGKRMVAVVYSSGQRDWWLLRFINLFTTGGDEMVSAGFGGLTAAQLTDLMNDYRNLAVPAQDSSGALPAEPAATATEPPNKHSKLVSQATFWAGIALLIGAYALFRFEVTPVAWVPLTAAGALLFATYVVRD